MFERILTPLDGSALAERVLPYAEGLAQEQHSELILVRVVVPVELVLSGSGYMDVNITAELRSTGLRDARSYLDAKAGELRQLGVRVRPVVVEGLPAAGILALAASERASLIAMTTHGRSGVSRLLHGSVAEQVLHEAPCPVFLVTGRGQTAEAAAEGAAVQEASGHA
jgi:nucleotide-binding universal stress UspA family protein